jgi:hypothetical protein
VELHNSYFSTNTIIIVLNKEMRLTEHEARLLEEKYPFKDFVGNMKEGNHVEHIRVDMGLLLRWDGTGWTGLLWLRIGTSVELSYM